MAERWDGLRIALWLVLVWASIFPHPIWAQNQESNSASVPFGEADLNGGIRDAFLAKLAEMRSITKRKDAAMAMYGELARVRRDFKNHLHKLDLQIESVESKGPSSTLSERQHLLHLRALARQIQHHINYNGIHMDSLLAEYDVLSRVAELESSYKKDEITKADFAMESRALRGELAQVNAERRVNSLGENIMEGFAHIESQMMSMH